MFYDLFFFFRLKRFLYITGLHYLHTEHWNSLLAVIIIVKLISELGNSFLLIKKEKKIVLLLVLHPSAVGKGLHCATLHNTL